MKQIIVIVLFTLCNACTTMRESSTIYAFRLQPGQDLLKSIQEYTVQHQIEAGWVAASVGSLTNYHIRFANQQTGEKGSGHFEILSLNGTVSVNGSHLHIAVADSTGRTIGGHLLEGSTIYTTAEIVIQTSHKHIFSRAKDGSTPWKELQITTKE
jgi:predicted DNA-binding protein with PD1-like motif